MICVFARSTDGILHTFCDGVPVPFICQTPPKKQLLKHSGDGVIYTLDVYEWDRYLTYAGSDNWAF